MPIIDEIKTQNKLNFISDELIALFNQITELEERIKRLENLLGAEYNDE